MKKVSAFAVCAVLAILSFSAVIFSQSADSVVGKWYTEDNESIVEVYKVGDKYFGKIVWLEEPNGDDGKPQLDKKNPDESKRSRQILGIVIMRNFVFKGDNKWEDGRIYDPASGKTYSCKMTLNGNRLNVRGFIGISAIGRTSAWNRAQ